ncbi:hypothetical protein GIB67_017334, partial [Kingdonia uniflora]
MHWTNIFSQDFQEDGAPIFLLTSQVGGLGLTLTKADRAIVVDPAWNPEYTTLNIVIEDVGMHAEFKEKAMFFLLFTMFSLVLHTVDVKGSINFSGDEDDIELDKQLMLLNKPIVKTIKVYRCTLQSILGVYILKTGENCSCEGRCMRSFHALIGTGEDSHCNILGFSRAQLEVVKKFLCLNCKYKIHTCYACGKLGSSDKSSGAEHYMQQQHAFSLTSFPQPVFSQAQTSNISQAPVHDSCPVQQPIIEDSIEDMKLVGVCYGGFTSEEDLLLVSTWLNTSQDAIHSTDQKFSTYWNRIWSYFEEHKNSDAQRSPNSLKKQWSHIQLKTNKLCRYYAAIVKQNSSGKVEADW